MSGIVGRIRLLTSLVLLISGMLQPLAAAQNACSRTHAPGQVEASGAADHSVVDAPALRFASAPHQHHEHIPTPHSAQFSSAPCVTAVILSEQPLLPQVEPAKELLSQQELLPPGLFIQSLFRPPRLS